MQYDYAVFIGRMQPPHQEHLRQIKRALCLADKVIICLGSHRAARNIKNPWTAEERREMVWSSLNDIPDINKRLLFTEVRDYYYNDTIWFSNLHQNVTNIINANCDLDNPKVCIVGSKKDESSWYLDMLPEGWKRELVAPSRHTNSTNIRHDYFKYGQISPKVTPGVREWLLDWSNSNVYEKLVSEFKFIEGYKEEWKSAPHPPTFVTTDVVVVKNGHVLVVRRKFSPGKGLIALPGGFVNKNETIERSAFRELKEETEIKVPKEKLMSYIIDTKVFDHPHRSLRGRTITHAFCVKLPDRGELPQVKGGDDAEVAFWMPLMDLGIREEEFYEDHVHIIQHFINKL